MIYNQYLSIYTLSSFHTWFQYLHKTFYIAQSHHEECFQRHPVLPVDLSWTCRHAHRLLQSFSMDTHICRALDPRSILEHTVCPPLRCSSRWKKSGTRQRRPCRVPMTHQALLLQQWLLQQQLLDHQSPTKLVEKVVAAARQKWTMPRAE